VVLLDVKGCLLAVALKTKRAQVSKGVWASVAERDDVIDVENGAQHVVAALASIKLGSSDLEANGWP
jgi:hypothetical protein